MADIAAAFRQRLDRDVASGSVPPRRARILRPYIDKIAALEARSHANEAELMEGMAELLRIAAAVDALPPSRGLPTPPAGSRARALSERWDDVQAAATRLLATRNAGAGFAAKAEALFRAVALADHDIIECGADDAAAREVEEHLRLLVADARALARTRNLMWARSDFAAGKLAAEPRLFFFSGAEALRARVVEAARALGLAEAAQGTGEEIGKLRWAQLRRSTIAVFDFASALSPSARASVGFELGSARVLGHPIVVLSGGQALPFDIEVEPVLLDGTNDHERLLAALDAATYTVVRDAGSSAGVLATTRELMGRFGRSTQGRARTMLAGASELVTADPLDPVALAARLETVMAELGPEAGELLTPVWPARYPAGDTPRLFHVMPFRPPWARSVSDGVRALCSGRATYVRHDDVHDQLLIRSLWDEIASATHVLVDLTDLNINVAIELGMALALGKPTTLVAQHDGSSTTGLAGQLFPNIAKRKVYAYAPADLAPLLAIILPEKTTTMTNTPNPTFPDRPGLQLMQRQFDEALAQDKLTNQCAAFIENAFAQRGVSARPDLVQVYVDAIRAYVQQAPAWIQTFWQAVCAHGVGAQVDWFLREVEGYCQTPSDLVPDWFGLMGVVDDAYVVRRMVLGLYQQLGAAQSNPEAERLEQTIRDDVLGLAVAMKLDQMIAVTLAGPAAAQAYAQAMQQQAQYGYTQSYQRSANSDAAIDRQINVMRPSISWSHSR